MRYLNLKFNSIVILGYTFISFIVLILNFITKGYLNQKLFSVYRARLDILFIFRLFSHILGHTGFIHFLNNFFIILVCGASVEEKYGSKNTLAFISITAFIIGILHITFFDTSLIGASGIAYMLLSLASFTNVATGQIPMTSILFLIICITRELYFFKRNDDVSTMSHIVGIVCGIIIGIIIYSRRRKTYVKNRNRRFYI